MVQFDIKWAASGPVYAGVLFGMVMMAVSHGSLNPLGLGIGMFFGGAMALPLAAAFLLAAILVAFAFPTWPFAAQFAAFAVTGGLVAFSILRELGRTFAFGGHGDAPGLAQLCLFIGAGLLGSLLCMVLASLRSERTAFRG